MDNQNTGQELNAQEQELLKAAVKAREGAYNPYSHFNVGAALLCDRTGTIYTGANVENASYGLTVCAERVALIKAISEGHRKFKVMAVACDVKEFTGPCGACRQFMAEFGLEWSVILVKLDLSWKKVKMSELLPLAFSPTSLQEENRQSEAKYDK